MAKKIKIKVQEIRLIEKNLKILKLRNDNKIKINLIYLLIL